LINTIDHTINIDLASKINMNQSIVIKKNDTNSHKFIINIFNNSVAYDLTGSTSRIYFKKADGNKVFLDCILDNTTVNKLSVLLTTQTLTFAGLVASEITIYGTDGEILTSVTFNFTVSDVIRDDVAIESVSEFTALTNALVKIDTAVENIGTIDTLNTVLEDNISTGDALDITLKGSIEIGNTTDDNIKASTILGNATDVALKSDIVLAGQNSFATEIETARGREVDLPVRLNKVDASLSQTAQQLILPTPGSKSIIAGDLQAGFYGFVQPSEMGLITSNASGNQSFNGANLALGCGLTSGTAFNDDAQLMKFAYKGKTLFIPLTGYRHSATWDAIYNAGLAFGTNDEGFLPPMGRCGVQLNINAADNSINTVSGDFLGDKTSGMNYADTVATVGESLTLKGWAAANNVVVTVVSITANKIIVSGATLTTEAGNKLSRFYKTSAKITQSKIITIGDKHYRVRLMKGAGSNPIDSYADSDRGSTGPDNEWNSLILPLHERAKLSNWNYASYAKDKDGGNIKDWGVGLTDENLRTHYNYGVGSYTWCQENSDTTTYRRVSRGYDGVSNSNHSHSWFVYNFICWRPVLESVDVTVNERLAEHTAQLAHIVNNKFDIGLNKLSYDGKNLNLSDKIIFKNGDTTTNNPTIVKYYDATSPREEFKLTAGGDDYDAGSNGAGFRLYGTNDPKHENVCSIHSNGQASFISAPSYDNLTGVKTNNVGGVVGVGKNLYTATTNSKDGVNSNTKLIGALNVINPDNRPALYITGASALEGDIAVPQGEQITMGHVNTSGVFKPTFNIIEGELELTKSNNRKFKLLPYVASFAELGLVNADFTSNFATNFELILDRLGANSMLINGFVSTADFTNLRNSIQTLLTSTVTSFNINVTSSFSKNNKNEMIIQENNGMNEWKCIFDNTYVGFKAI